jgi:hypothetical protein
MSVVHVQMVLDGVIDIHVIVGSRVDDVLGVTCLNLP